MYSARSRKRYNRLDTDVYDSAFYAYSNRAGESNLCSMNHNILQNQESSSVAPHSALSFLRFPSNNLSSSPAHCFSVYMPRSHCRTTSLLALSRRPGSQPRLDVRIRPGLRSRHDNLKSWPEGGISLAALRDSGPAITEWAFDTIPCWQPCWQLTDVPSLQLERNHAAHRYVHRW